MATGKDLSDQLDQVEADKVQLANDIKQVIDLLTNQAANQNAVDDAVARLKVLHTGLAQEESDLETAAQPPPPAPAPASAPKK